MTDPKVMAAFLRGQANALQRAAEAQTERSREIVADVIRQLREVAQREDNA